MMLKNKKLTRTLNADIDQDELCFMFNLGKFLRDIAEELKNIPDETLDKYEARILQSDPDYVYDYGYELENIARRCIVKEYNKIRSPIGDQSACFEERDAILEEYAKKNKLCEGKKVRKKEKKLENIGSKQ